MNGYQSNEGDTVNRKLSEYTDYDGTDASLEISLYEYGLLWKLKDPEKKEYDIVYGVDTDANCNYRRFASTTMSEKEFIELTEESWFDKKGFDSFRGTEEISFPDDLYSAIRYYGNENIFGGTSNTFKIEEDI
jgi:hypothetical protein